MCTQRHRRSKYCILCTFRSRCSEPCKPGQVKRVVSDDNCCWLCEECQPQAFLKDEKTCEDCEIGKKIFTSKKRIIQKHANVLKQTFYHANTVVSQIFDLETIRFQ